MYLELSLDKEGGVYYSLFLLITRGGVSHYGLANYQAKRRIYENFKYFTMQKYNLGKNPLKRNQNPSRYYYNSIITNLKVSTQAKIS
jgi:hypothetical protein